MYVIYLRTHWDSNMMAKMVLAKRRATPNATLRPITADSKSVTEIEEK